MWSRSGRIVGHHLDCFEMKSTAATKQSCRSEECKEDYLVSSHSRWPAKLRSLAPRQCQDKRNALNLWPGQPNLSKAGLTLTLNSTMISAFSYTPFHTLYIFLFAITLLPFFCPHRNRKEICWLYIGFRLLVMSVCV